MSGMPGYSAEDVKEICTRNGRVCPQPGPWRELYDLLTAEPNSGTGADTPSLPLILGAWHLTADWEKRRRINHHIEWAASHGLLDQVAGFLLGLTESEWHRSDEG